MSRLKSLVKDTAIYGVSSILGRTLNWLLVPLYTQYLLPADYGIVTEFYAYVAFLVIIYTYGMETAFFRYSTKLTNSNKQIFNQSQSSIIFTSLILSGLAVIFATPIVNFLEYPGSERYVIWFAIIIAIDAIVAIPFAKLRLENKSKKFAAIKLASIFINIGFNLFFIILCPIIVNSESPSFLRSVIEAFFDDAHLVDYIFISNLIASCFLIILFLRSILTVHFQLNKKLLWKMYVYAFPIMIMGLAGVTNEMLSRAVLKKWLPANFYPDYSNQAALGIFGAVYKLSIFMTLAIQAFRYAAEPFFFSRAKDKDSKELFSNVMHWFIIFSSFIFIIISLNLDVIGYLFLRNPTYREGLNVVPVLLLANLFYGIYYNLSVWFKLTDKTYYGTIISIFGAVVTILLNYLLIPILGYLGSSLASLACYISMALLSFSLGKKHYSIQYKTGKGLTYIVLSSLIIFVGYYQHTSFSATNKLIQLSMILIFGTIVWILEKDSIKTIRHSFKSNHENKNHK